MDLPTFQYYRVAMEFTNYLVPLFSVGGFGILLVAQNITWLVHVLLYRLLYIICVIIHFSYPRNKSPST